MFKHALLVCAWLGFAAGAHAQSGTPLNFNPMRNYGIPKSIVDFSALKHCGKINGQWPLIRYKTPSLRSQDCFASDAKDLKVIVISYHTRRQGREELVAPIAIIFAREYDDPATAKRDYREDWALVNVGAETSGVIDEVWRRIDGNVRQFMSNSAIAVFDKLVRTYDPQMVRSP